MISACLALVIGVSSFFLAESQTPGTGIQGPDPELAETENVRQLLWGEDALPLEESESDSASWVPVSLRYVEHDSDFYVFLELKNDSDTEAIAPILVTELLIEGDSYGEEEIRSDNSWVLAGESAFYHTLGFYGGSLGIGDWDQEMLSIKPDLYTSEPTLDPSLIRVEDDRLFNDGEEPLGEVYFAAIIRDNAGIYTATCSGPYTGAVTPPGRSVKLSSALDEAYIPGCGFFFAGDPASEALGYGQPYRTEYVISGII